MHARHRNPGNGYRSNSMGMDRMGMGRISPEGSLRSGGGGGYYSEQQQQQQHHRSFNRGGGYGRSKASFQQPPPPPPPPLPPAPRKGDIFMDAGRLAAEYLVAQGLLPPVVLNRDDRMNIPAGDGGRTSALARLGGDVAGGSRRGRYGADEFSSSGNPRRGKKRNGGYRGGYGSEYYGRSGSFSDRHSRASSEGEDDSGRHEDHKYAREVGNVWQQGPFAPEVEDAVEAKMDKPSSSKDGANGGCEVGEIGEVSEEQKEVGDEEIKDKDCGNDDETKKQNVVSESLPIEVKAVEAEGEGNSFGGSGIDLLKLCKFANVPTKIRSALTTKSVKVDPAPCVQQENTTDTGLQLGGSQVLADNSSLDVPSGTAILDKATYADCVDPDTSKVESSQSVENLVESVGTEENRFTRSQSLPDRAFNRENEQELSRGPAGLRSFSFVVKDRGEKRDSQGYDNQVEAKKPREWHPYMSIETDDCFQISNLSEKKLSPLEDSTSTGDKVIVAIDHDSSVVNDSRFREDGTETCVDFMQEKQLFPNSFKICDLNEVNDAHENRRSTAVINIPDVSEVKKEEGPVDIDLSMSNFNMSHENSRRSVDVKEIEVIDLENDSIPEKEGTEFVPLDGFNNQAQNSSDIPDGQDGYGIMISELMENDFPSCSSVPDALAPMPNDIGVPNAEGTLADDDSIYMALGEIPLTFMSPWERPPPQEYEKPF